MWLNREKFHEETDFVFSDNYADKYLTCLIRACNLL